MSIHPYTYSGRLIPLVPLRLVYFSEANFIIRRIWCRNANFKASEETSDRFIISTSIRFESLKKKMKMKMKMNNRVSTCLV